MPVREWAVSLVGSSCGARGVWNPRIGKHLVIRQWDVVSYEKFGKEIGRISSDDLLAEVVWSGSCSGGGRSIVSCKFVDILLLFILVTCRGQFDLYLLSFSSTSSTYSSPKICLFLLRSKTVWPAILLKNLISTDVNSFFFFKYFFCCTQECTG